ncbi:MAG: hypothetical protein IKY44_04315, partial [Clostridia bacterium]|nr:hypothetical protein [Clostridia bacterium]
MKKAVFSPITKVIAFILAVACIVLAASVMANTFVRYEKENEQIYDFEPSFDQASHFIWMVREPAYAVSYAIDDFVQNGADKGLYFYIEDQLKKMEHGDKIEYLIIVNGVTSTNCWEEKEYFLSKRFYAEIKRDESERIVVNDYYANATYYDFVGSSISNLSDNFEIYVSVDESYVQQCEQIWYAQRDYILQAIAWIAGLLGGALLLTIYLVCVCGKRADGETRAIWLDSIWTELHLALIAFAGIDSAFLLLVLYEEYALFEPWTMELLIAITATVAGVAGALIINSLLSLVRKLKCGKFLNTCVIFIVVRWLCKVLWRALRALGRGIKRCARLFYTLLTKKSGLLTILVMLGYTVIAAIVGVCLTDDDTAIIGIIIWLLSFGFVCLVLAYRGRELEDV